MSMAKASFKIDTTNVPVAESGGVDLNEASTVEEDFGSHVSECHQLGPVLKPTAVLLQDLRVHTSTVSPPRCHRLSVTTPVSLPQCHRPSVTAPVSPPQCHRPGVTAPVSPPQCHHTSVTAPVSPPQCHRPSVTTPVSPPQCQLSHCPSVTAPVSAEPLPQRHRFSVSCIAGPSQGP